MQHPPKTNVPGGPQSPPGVESIRPSGRKDRPLVSQPVSRAARVLRARRAAPGNPA
ncbi:hypothetical protein C7S14_3722 [Burkholderia cepacia]|nr:hypothetical protein C7S14_3722 [Burkholderia cepacia]